MSDLDEAKRLLEKIADANDSGSTDVPNVTLAGQAGEVFRDPAGRPKGSRNKLSDAFLQALADDFEAHGKGVVEKVRTGRPQDYLKIVAGVMPKRMEVEDVGPPLRAADLSDDELAAIIGRAKLTVV